MAEEKELKAEKTGDAADGSDELGLAPETGGLNKKLVAALVVLLVVLGGAAGAYFTGALDGLLGKNATNCEDVKEGDKNYDACAAKLAAEQGTAHNTPGAFFTIPDMIVNLNATARQTRFLKISLKVELERNEDVPRFEAVLPRVIDQFQTYLRELRIEDLRGSSGMYRMKIELLSRVRAAAPDIRIRDILFQEVLVQ